MAAASDDTCQAASTVPLFKHIVRTYCLCKCLHIYSQGPFPGYNKAFVPLYLFPFYQYAVVARSYVLIPLLLFSVAAIYDKRAERPFLFVFLLILLANVCFHGTIIASGIIFVFLLETFKAWSNLNLRLKTVRTASFGFFGAAVFLLYLQLKPAPDLITVASLKADFGSFYSVTFPALSDSLATNINVQGGNKNLFYFLSELVSGAAIVISLLWFMVRRKFLLFSVPLIGLGLLFSAVYNNVWHQGTMFYLWLFVLWISFDNQSKDCTRNQHVLRNALSVLMAVIFCIQIYWSYNSFVFDYAYNYSASRDVAAFIKDNRFEGKKIYMSGFHCISILPYFSDNIFINYNNRQKPCFWLWSTKNKIYSEGYLDVGKYDPDIIILGIKNYSKDVASHKNTWLPEITGYKLLKLFNGNLYWKDKPFEKDSFAIYIK